VSHAEKNGILQRSSLLHQKSEEKEISLGREGAKEGDTKNSAGQ